MAEAQPCRAAVRPGLLAVAWLLLVVVQASLLLRWPGLHSPGRIRPLGLAPAPAPVGRRIAAAIGLAARAVPGAACLAQALAARALLARLGYGSILHLGVGPPGQDGRFIAHAWLSCGTTIVIGADIPNLPSYTVLTEIA